jgi:hypothetical protein
MARVGVNLADIDRASEIYRQPAAFRAGGKKEVLARCIVAAREFSIVQDGNFSAIRITLAINDGKFRLRAESCPTKRTGPAQRHSPLRPKPQRRVSQA